MSKLNQEIYATIESRRSLQVVGEYRYAFFDGIYLKRSWGGKVRNVSVLVAIGVRVDARNA